MYAFYLSPLVHVLKINPLIDCGQNMIARDHQNTFRTGIVQAKGFHSHRPEYNYVHCNEYNITFEPSSYT